MLRLLSALRAGRRGRRRHATELPRGRRGAGVGRHGVALDRGDEFTEFRTEAGEGPSFATIPPRAVVRLYVGGIEWEGELQS